MKKIISTLAALSFICGSLGTAAPAFAETVLTATASTQTEDFDLDGAHSLSEADGITYYVYNSFAVITKVDKEDIEEFTVPETYKELPVVGLTDDPFTNCKKLKKINLSKNTAVFDWIYIAIEGIEEITVPEDNKYFSAVDGVIYTKDMKELVACPSAGGKTELTIPDETVSIDRGALACCRDLKKVTMGANVEKIYPSAFWGCSGLTEVNFSQKLKAIGFFAFAGCSSLESVDLPDSLEEMYEGVFKDTACVENYNGIHYVDNWAVGSDKNILQGDIRKGTVGTACGIFSERYSMKWINVPSSVKHITESLIIGLGQNYDIDFVSFHNDTIPDRCLAINGIKGIEIYDPKCKITDSKTALPAYWVEHDDSFVPSDKEEQPTEYKLGRTTVSSSSSGSKTVQKAINTELIELDEDISNDDDYVQKMAALDEKIQKDNSSFAIAQPVEGTVHSAPIKIGARTKVDTLIYGAPGSTAEDYAVKYRRMFKPLEVRDDLKPTIINDDDAGVTYKKYMDTYATANVYINNGDTIKEITIAPEADGAPVKDIFVTLANADKINIPATAERYVHQVDSAEDNVAYYNVDKDNPYLTSVDGIIYSKDMTKLIKVPSRYAGKKIVVPDGVKVIDSFAFYSLDNVESIELPDSVEIIGKKSFASSKITSINLPENLDVIGDYAFIGCTGIKDISIPDSVNHIGYNAFLDVPAVKSEDGLDYLGNWCVGVTEVAPEKSKPANIKEGTIGVAKLNAAGYIAVPKSITKMSWEMVGCNNNVKRADVYSHVIEADAFKNAKYMKDIYIYDPDCEICAGYWTIPPQHIEIVENKIKGLQEVSSNSYYRTVMQEPVAGNGEILADTVIHGYAGSTAEAYAKMYGVKFEEINTSTVYKNGDLNGDGALNVADLVMMSRFIKGMTSLDEAQTKSADLNGDGNVDIFDMVEFRKKILESMRDN
ncbi:leucine-rich repeat protein [Ruminococcus flavefaciens]|uniref:Leucine rich repeat-containing protein n=1 Tax=Ruminococcus flavefaciens TaxID=1265 RepID=A0A1K1MW95_RUMFL|nr:leucine-rich repeat protein [Ruminococcus flavefaciens]SFW27387.1 Leucine rich repeat-containing protein [Ruminococcus flavefaciens]